MSSRTMTSYLQKDLDLCAGEPDGELVFVDLIGFEVPSYIDERYDLVLPGQVKGRPHLQHHVPFKLRGAFKIEELPDKDLWVHEVDPEGNCVCSGKAKGGMPCRKAAWNRSEFCSLHGGALHPADRQIKNLGDGIVPDSSKVRKLTRAQKVAMKLIPVEDLTDIEIHGMFVIDDDGKSVKSRRISDSIHQAFAKELMSRMSDFMVEKLPTVLQDMADIGHDPTVEPADRIKANIWLAERVVGKTPDVVLHGSADKPYEQIITRVESGSREEYRRALESSNVIEGEVVELGDNGQNGDSSESTGIHPGADSDSGDSHSDQGSDPSNATNSALADSLGSTATRQEKLKAARDAQRIAKNRRYAARAVGATNTTDLPFTLEYKRRKDGTFNVRFWPAEDLTPEIVDRIQTQEALDHVTQAQA